VARTDDVVEGIKQMILTGDLRPGDRLPVEKDLAARLGLSRGSLREGVRALTMMGVLDTRQGNGTYVTSLEPNILYAPFGFVADLQHQDSAKFLAVRRVLEAEAAALAAARITDEQLDTAAELLAEAERTLAGPDIDHESLIGGDREFHRIIAAAADNTVLAALIEAVSGRTRRSRLWRSITEEGAADNTIAEHRSILAALRARDSDAARLRMAVHILGVEEFVRALPVENAARAAVPPAEDGDAQGFAEER